MAENAFKPKQLVDVNLATEFGGIEDLESFKAEGVARQDYTYVPGFSDMRVNRDLALGKLARGEIRASEVPILEWNARWYRCATKDGHPDGARSVTARNEGYAAATKDDVGKPWMTELPPGGYVAPDGTIRNSGGDLQLFITDRAHAAKNAMRRKIRTEEMVDGMDMAVGGLGAVGKSHKGADPVITKELGGPIK